MRNESTAARAISIVGDQLRHWRSVRGLSQLELGMRAGVSTRHLSFVESGRANASREMLHVLADALDVPLRERNALLGAAGFAQPYRESELDGADLAAVRRALSSMLDRLDPYPCIVLDRHWNVTLANGGALRMLAALLSPDELAQLQPLNAARLLFHPVMRPRVANWEVAAGSFVQRLHREALSGDIGSRALLDEVCSMPDVPKRWRVADLVCRCR